MRYCRKCVQPDTRPGITFDEDGVCFPCRVAEMSVEIDWHARRKELEAIADWGRSNGSPDYDCIIGVSGGKDSMRQALYARDELGLKPLLVSTIAPPEMMTDIGGENLCNLVELGFDLITMGPAPQRWKRLMRETFVKYGNYCKTTELALYSGPIRAAIAFNVPLILLGENNALAYGEKTSSTGGEAKDLRNYNTLSGGLAFDMLPEGMPVQALIPYNMPSDTQMQAANVRIVYMGYYIEDFNNFRNAEVAMAHGLKIRDAAPEDIGSLHRFDALDDDFVPVNQMVKHFKFGFGKANDEICELIRLGRLDREEGIDMLRRYDGRCHPRYVHRFQRYLGMSEQEFWDAANRFRNPDLWEEDENGEWRMKQTLWPDNRGPRLGQGR